jgi:alpha-ketoglutarate-dependent taurine dioxygenase
MNCNEVQTKLATLDAERETLRRYWVTVLPHVVLPDDEQITYWLGVFGFAATHYATREAARKNAKLGFKMSREHVLRFVSSVAASCPRAEHNRPKPERIESQTEEEA